MWVGIELMDTPEQTSVGYGGARHGTRNVSAAMMPGAAATLACIYEATAPKPGNVHPGAAFDDTTTYSHFVRSAVIVGPILEQSCLGIGKTVLGAVSATREAVGTNTNLGALLLIAPLAAVPMKESLRDGIAHVLSSLTREDAQLEYQAIRLSRAGSLGSVERADVRAEPPPEISLVDAMQLAADRDLVARQYTNEFEDVFSGAAYRISSALAHSDSLSEAIVHAHVAQMAASPDSLIARKCGTAIADESRRRAADVLAAGRPGDESYGKALLKFDAWLRADGHRRNPGTSADFIAAGLFVLLREGQLNWNRW
jgi:triphosphoribosyl-dephospho-CoA synthase